MGGRRYTQPDAACLVCGLIFKPRRDWHKFCSDVCRSKAWQTKDLGLSEASCKYCGVPADTVDHVPPLVARSKLVELKLDARYPFVEVRACFECNTLLGCLALWTVSQRKAYIKKRLRRRYRKYLVIPDWSDVELLRLGQTLQQHTIHGLAIREWTKARLAY